MTLLNLSSLEEATLRKDPFDYMIVPGAIDSNALDAINRDFPDIDAARNIPLEDIECHGAFRDLINEVRSREFQRKISKKFGVKVNAKMLSISVRGLSSIDEGDIHTDSEKKIITVLIYLNKTWQHNGGRLRLLRSASDIEAYIEEVAPEKGNLLAFKRSDCSFHGYKPYEGERRAIQLNWIESKWTSKFKELRARLRPKQ
jgi:hypothetical protein